MLASRCARDTSLSYFEEHKLACESWTVEEWKTHLIILFALCHTNIRQRFLDDTKESLNQSMQRVVDDKGIVRSLAGDPVHGGSTASVCVCIRPDDPQGNLVLITANTGDSTGLLIRLGDDEEKKAGDTFSFLTEVFARCSGTGVWCAYGVKASVLEFQD